MREGPLGNTLTITKKKGSANSYLTGMVPLKEQEKSF